jgi:hypothetical protein
VIFIGEVEVERIAVSLFETAAEKRSQRAKKRREDVMLFCFEKIEQADVSRRKIFSNFQKKACLDIAILENLGETSGSQTTRTRTLSST